MGLLCNESETKKRVGERVEMVLHDEKSGYRGLDEVRDVGDVEFGEQSSVF
jgi:hypothetical protein